MSKLQLLLAILLLSAIGVQAQTTISEESLRKYGATKTYGEVSVHDPSVVYDSANNKFAIVGSHIASAESDDLIDWTTPSNSVLAESYSTAFKSCPTHTVQVSRSGTVTTETLGSYDAGAFCAIYASGTEADWISGDMWAPDVIYNPNMGKWCLYLSLNGDCWASVIVLMTGDNPTGPFTYEAPIVFSGFNGQSYSGKSVNYKDTDLELVLGTQSSLPARYNTSDWGLMFPNCIDPCVFFDSDGELWMSYGSWSGGIFMLKLDKTTGLRDYTYEYDLVTYSGNSGGYTGYDSDPYFGLLVAGGAYASGEGSYIQKIGDYYFLFMSYGGYAPNGGYDMRVFRSESPTGPFYDFYGSTSLYHDYRMNYGSNAKTTRGSRLLGAYNDWGTMTTGECAQGHNSACVDGDGEAFLVYHTKFNDGTYGHQVRVRQLFLNERGWIVASPFRYTGKQTTQKQIESKQLFTADEIAGRYKLLLHPYYLDCTKYEEATPVEVVLYADGTITGEDYSGTWSYSEDGKSYVRLDLNDTRYYGVALKQNIDGLSEAPVICFTAISKGTAGVPVWLHKVDSRLELAEAYNTVVPNFLNNNEALRTDAPEIENETIDVSYDCLNASTGAAESDVFTSEGIFTPTADGHQVKIAATLSNEDYTCTTQYYTKYTMDTSGNYPDPTYYPNSTYQNTECAFWTNFSDRDYVLEAGHSCTFVFNNYSSKAATWDNWCLYGANTTHGGTGYSEYFGVRSDGWDNTTYSSTGIDFEFSMNNSSFCKEMHGSQATVTCTLTTAGKFTMVAEILSSWDNTYTNTYTKTISTKPSEITLFFVSEYSYINGKECDPTGIEEITTVSGTSPRAGSYNIAGQKVGANYRGIVIENGQKILRK